VTSKIVIADTAAMAGILLVHFGNTIKQLSVEGVERDEERVRPSPASTVAKDNIAIPKNAIRFGAFFLIVAAQQRAKISLENFCQAMENPSRTLHAMNGFGTNHRRASKRFYSNRLAGMRNRPATDRRRKLTVPFTLFVPRRLRR
jgi:hypothetical protein